MRLQVALSRPLSHRVDLEMKLLKSPESCRALTHALQQGVDATLIKETWQACFAAELPGQLGCVGIGAGSKRVCNELASTALVLVSSLVAQLGQGMWSHKFLLPYAFVGLVSDDPSAVQESLQHAQKCWEVLLELEKTALTDPDCLALCQSLPLWRDHFSREVLVMLRERRFLQVPPFLRSQLQAWASTFGGTLIIENCFKEMRAAQKKHMSNQLPPESAWHLAFHSDLLSQYRGVQRRFESADRKAQRRLENNEL